MKRSIHRFSCVALALIALFLTSAVSQCSLRGLAVEVPDLEVNQIEGLQLWRADDETSQAYLENCRIVFGETHVANDREGLEFTLLDPDGETTLFSGHAAVDRSQGEDGPVRLYFIFSDWQESPGWFRVSSFNAVGESDLSDEAAFL
jgi:hypothetical protein